MFARASSILSAAAASLLFTLPVQEATQTKLAVPASRPGPQSGHVPLVEQPRVRLLQADAGEGSAAATHGQSSDILASARQQGKLQQPKSAHWFATFDEGESTYDEDADNGRAHLAQNNIGRAREGWDPRIPNPDAENVKNAVFFDESNSGAYKGAWQTNFPPLTDTVAKGGAATGNWYRSDGGPWQEEYVNMQSLRAGAGTSIPASWFDSRVRQYDGFGRQQMANVGTPRTFWDWEERSVNTTLSCKEPGCVANVSLQAPFDPATEIAERCRLSVFFHPTDFDEWYSGEKVEWIEVSNYRVNTACYPMASGCNATAAKRLFPCVNWFDIDNIILNTNNTGTLQIAAKIPDVVDECPYKTDDKDEGSHLAAVPMVTCMVKPITTVQTVTPPPVKPTSLEGKVSCKAEAPIKCTTRGCSGDTFVQVSNFCGQPGNKCKLNLTIYQTDYDEEDGTVEMIEWIKVGGVTVKTDVKPGKNPCKQSWGGKPADQKDLTYLAVENHDVSENATTGYIQVEGKISDWVDECGYEGYLFNGLATVDCGEVSYNATESLLQMPQRSTSHLRGHAEKADF